MELHKATYKIGGFERLIKVLCIITFVCVLLLSACGGSVEPDSQTEKEAATTYHSIDICAFEPPRMVGFTCGMYTVFLEPAYFQGQMEFDEIISAQRTIAVFQANGNIEHTENFRGAAVKAREGRIDFVFEDGRRIVNIAGIIADPPEIGVTQVYEDALRLLQNGHRVTVVVLDGWGIKTYHYFADMQPFLHNIHSENAQVAHTVFPPYTPVVMSSIFTGTLPNVHGVHDRRTRIMAAPDIFEAAVDLGFSVTQVQGAVNVVRTSADVVLMPDLNNEFGTDDEVFDASMARINDSDLMFIHFKGIDDQGHTYGPFAAQVGERIALIDGFLEQLLHARGGAFIIVGDHGMSDSSDLNDPRRLGDHRWISHEDFFVPYIIIFGGE